MTKKKPVIYIRDDQGHAWYYSEIQGRGKIRSVLGDLSTELGKGENGYDCDGLEDGIRLLNEYGYISGLEFDDEDKGELEYFDLKGHAEGW